MPLENENPGALAGASEVNVENIVADDCRATAIRQGRMFSWVHQVAMDATLPPQTARIAAQVAMLAVRAGTDGPIAPKLPDLAAALAMCIPSVRACISAMTRAGHLDFQHRRGKGRACLISPRIRPEDGGDA